MISRPHWAKNTLYKTVNRSLCARCLFISWSQVCVTYYQTRMTMVDSSGGMSRSILSQLVKLTGSVQFQNPPFPVLKLSFWQRQDFRNIPGILCIRAHSVAWLSSKYIKINSHPLYLRYYGEAKTKKIIWREEKYLNKWFPLCGFHWRCMQRPSRTSYQTSHRTNTERWHTVMSW